MTVEQIRPKADPEIVHAVREMLERAERGELQNLVAVASGTDGVWTTWTFGRRDLLVAALERLKFRILRDWVG